jgi:Tol biopolymer transport system component
VTPDGDWLTTNHRDDIWMVPIRGGGEPKVLIQTPFIEGGANFSPDGQWMVYQGFETGTSTHYLRRADGSGPRITISAGAAYARWSRDGRTLFAVEQNTTMTARDFHADGTLGPPRRLFEFPYHFDWDVAPDGRFLVVSDAEAPRLVFVENWLRELSAMFPQQ